MNILSISKRNTPDRCRAIALLAAVTVGLMLTCIQAASAQAYPSRPVRVIVPFAPGGQVDTVSRIAMAKLSAALDKQFIVDNRPGAGGNLGTGIAAKADPDGYTLVMVSSSFAINPSLSPYTPYDPRRSFEAVHLVASAPNVLLVHPSLPVKSVKDLIAFAHARPNQVAFASSGVGTPTHLAGELFSSMAKLRLIHVPYKGGGPATIDLISGQVSMMFLGMAPAMPLIASGKVRAIATTGVKRTTGLPQVPTVAESGFPSFNIVNWIGLLAPAGTPHAIVDRLHNELSKSLTSGDGKERLEKLGLDVSTLNPEEFGQLIETEITRWASVVKSASASTK